MTMGFLGSFRDDPLAFYCIMLVEFSFCSGWRDFWCQKWDYLQSLCLAGRKKKASNLQMLLSRESRRQQQLLLPSALRRSIALSSIFEPIRDLRKRQTSLLGQHLLLVGRRVAIFRVAIFQRIATFLFEAVDCLLTVPDRLRQRILFPQTVLVDGT